MRRFDSTRVYVWVVLTEAWPSSSWMVRRSAPPSSRCVAKECRSVCGETPPWSAARRAWRPSRRRTSEVERRRPLFERNSARSPLRRAGQGRPARAPGSARAPARRARRRAPRASCRPCPPRAPPRRRGRSTPRPGPRAPGPAGRPSRPARAGRGRAGRAARSAGTRSSSSATSPLAQHARQVGVAPRRGHQVARVGLERRRARPGGGRRRGRPPACGPTVDARGAALGQHAGEAAQLAVARAPRARGPARPPTRRAGRGPRRRRGGCARPCRACAATRRSRAGPRPN